MPFANSSDGSFQAPSHLPSDYVELVILSIVLIVGTPLNVTALSKLLPAYLSVQQVDLKCGFNLLKIHLTVANLVIIVGYCPSKIGWLISYKWLGGDFFCRAIQFCWLFSFHLSSFVVVCIAIDRLRTVARLASIAKGHSRRLIISGADNVLGPIKRSLIFAYLAAVLCSVPQWAVWGTIDLESSGDWSQCATIWHRQRVIDFLDGRPEQSEYFWEQVYQLGHLVTVFWAPFLVICVAYGCIVVRLLEYSIRPYTAVPRTLNEQSVIEQSVNANTDHMQLGRGRAAYGATNNVQEERKMELLEAPSMPYDRPRKQSISPGQVPTWRLQMRSRMFRTTAYVLLAYAVFWLPYNAIALAMFVDNQVQIFVSEHLAVLRCLILFNAVLNPFIYGLSNV
uniref:G-protein coupled receptors family 1 profile domain-containing protein n=1 Tax=Plectus sambesii TaxID=2011161 RepID=A0A914WMW7_9BILA